MNWCSIEKRSADQLPEPADPERLGRVVAAGKEVDAVLARLAHHRFAGLAGDQGVESERPRLVQGEAAEPVTMPTVEIRSGPASKTERLLPDGLRQPAPQLVRGRSARSLARSARRPTPWPGRRGAHPPRDRVRLAAARCCRSRGGRRGAGGRRRARRPRRAGRAAGRPSAPTGPRARSPQSRPWWVITSSAPPVDGALEQSPGSPTRPSPPCSPRRGPGPAGRSGRSPRTTRSPAGRRSSRGSRPGFAA